MQPVCKMHATYADHGERMKRTLRARYDDDPAGDD
jgi:hypothetical protein